MAPKKNQIPQSDEDLTSQLKRLDDLEQSIGNLKELGERLKDVVSSSNDYGVLLYLRHSSVHWPHKIKDFLFWKERNLWVWKRSLIPLDEWNKKQEQIFDEVARYDFTTHPGIMVVEMPKTEDVPLKVPEPWEMGLAAAEKKKQEDKPNDEQQRPPERSTPETLY